MTNPPPSNQPQPPAPRRMGTFQAIMAGIAVLSVPFAMLQFEYGPHIFLGFIPAQVIVAKLIGKYEEWRS